MSDEVSYPLHEAAASGDIDTLNCLLDDGDPVNGRDEVGRTPLFCAAKNGEVAAARHLLKRGACVGCESTGATTALMTAARGGYADMVRLLLANGADPNQIVHPQPIVLTPEMEEAQRKLHERLGLPGPTTDEFAAARRADLEPRQANTLACALMSRDFETVMALLEAGADVNYTGGKSGISPLNTATSFATPEIIRALVQHGASLKAVDDSGHSVLAKAVLIKSVDVARLLLELGARPDSHALRFAIAKDDPEKVKLLLSFGADPDDESPSGIPAAAAAYGKPEILALLAAHRGTDWHRLVVAGDLPGVRTRLEAGANIDVRDDKGKTALTLAAEYGRADLVKLLVERGADVNAGDRFQAAPLMYGVRKDHADVVRELLAHGANANATNQWGQTAFTSATSPERREIRELIIDAGAPVGIVEAAQVGDNAKVMRFLAEGVSVDCVNPAGTTALMAAASRGDIDLATALHDRGADLSAQDSLGETAFHHAVLEACGDGDTTLLARMLGWGADVNGASKRESGCLRMPVMLGSEPVLRFLLDHGADLVNCRNALGQPLLHTAILHSRRKLNTIEILLEYGADVEVTDKMGSTPLCEILGVSNTLHGENVGEPDFIRSVVKLLIASGADVNAPSRRETPLDCAIGSGDIESVRLLLDAGAEVKNIGGLRVMMHNAGRSSPEMTALLRERGAKIPEPLPLPANLPEGFANAMKDGKMPPDFISKMLDMMNAKRKKKDN